MPSQCSPKLLEISKEYAPFLKCMWNASSIFSNLKKLINIVQRYLLKYTLGNNSNNFPQVWANLSIVCDFVDKLPNNSRHYDNCNQKSYSEDYIFQTASLYFFAKFLDNHYLAHSLTGKIMQI